MESRSVKILFKHDEMQSASIHILIRQASTVEEYVMDHVNGLHATHFTSIPVSVDVKAVHLTFLEVKQEEAEEEECGATRNVSECECSLPSGDTLIVKVHAQKPVVHDYGMLGYENILFINTGPEHQPSPDDDSKIIATGKLLDLGFWNPSSIYHNIVSVPSQVSWNIQMVKIPENAFDFKLTRVTRKENEDCLEWEDPPFVNRLCGIDQYSKDKCWLCVSNWGNVDNTFVQEMSTTKTTPDVHAVARQIVNGVIENARDVVTTRALKKHGLYCQLKKFLSRAFQRITNPSVGIIKHSEFSDAL